MMVSTGLHRFVSVCTNYFCSKLIVKDFTVLHRYGGNTGTKAGTKFPILQQSVVDLKVIREFVEFG
jgi:hypothetical protein